jgi:ATP-dependent RNA helicase DDX35
MTDGVLFREAMYDPLLSRYSVIMVDEAHERTLHTDLILGLLKKIMRRRPELKVIIASATLDAQRFMDYFKVIGRAVGAVSGPTMPPAKRPMVASLDEEDEEAEDTAEFKVIPSREPAVLSLEGRPFPLTIHHTVEPCSDVVSEAVSTVLAIDREEGPGDVLVFLAGKAEIDLALEYLADALAEMPEQRRRLAAFPLHASMSTERQLEAFQPLPKGARKVVLATNIAEASLTLDGIVYVVDGGTVKRRVHLLDEGIDSMRLLRISKASAVQRAGRAGRTQPGKAYRLYTVAECEQMPQCTPPELQLVDLTAIVLQLKALRIDDMAKFDFIDKPGEGQLIRARENLRALGAIDDEDRLTADVGRILAELPVDPRLGKMLLAAQSRGCVGEMLSIVAVLAVGGGPSLFLSDIPADVKRKQSVHEGDLLSYLNIYNAYMESRRTGNPSKWCGRHGVSQTTLEKAHRFRSTLAAQLTHFGLASITAYPDAVQTADLLQCIAAGLFTNLAILDEATGSYRHVRGGKRELWLHPDSVLFKASPPPMILWWEALETTKAFLRDISVTRKDWLLAVAPHYYRLAGRSHQ